MINHPDDPSTSPAEDTEYADIYIPVPYDPEIPGVRCVDADMQNLDAVTDDGGDDIELQNRGDKEALDP